MSSLCKSANADKDQWENLGGFFEFPNLIRGCGMIEEAQTGQGSICVQAVFKDYTSLCQSCFANMVSCVADFCTDECLDCKSIFNTVCQEEDVAGGCIPRCVSPDNEKYASPDCVSCLDTCYPAFQSCSGYSATRCTTCINPNAEEPQNIIPFVAGGVVGFLAIMGLVVFLLMQQLRKGRGVYKANEVVIAKLAGDGPSTSKKSLKDDYSIGSQFSTKRAQTVPPGLGFTQPARPQVRQYLPDDFVMEQSVEEYPQFIVAYNFEAENTDELDAELGESVIGLSRIDENWWMVQNESGRRGLIPTDFLREPEPEEKLSPSTFAPSNSKARVIEVKQDPEDPEF